MFSWPSAKYKIQLKHLSQIQCWLYLDGLTLRNVSMFNLIFNDPPVHTHISCCKSLSRIRNTCEVGLSNDGKSLENALVPSLLDWETMTQSLSWIPHLVLSINHSIFSFYSPSKLFHCRQNKIGIFEQPLHPDSSTSRQIRSQYLLAFEKHNFQYNLVLTDYLWVNGVNANRNNSEWCNTNDEWRKWYFCKNGVLRQFLTVPNVANKRENEEQLYYKSVDFSKMVKRQSTAVPFHH